MSVRPSVCPSVVCVHKCGIVHHIYVSLQLVCFLCNYLSVAGKNFEWVRRYLFLTLFMWEANISSHPSEAVLGFRMVRLRVLMIFSYVFFTLSIIIITYTLSLNRWETLIVRSCPFIRQPWRILPPVQNQAETRWARGRSQKKMVSVDSLGQCTLYWTIGTTKAQWISIKTHLLSSWVTSQCK